jgi:4-hydroxy-3-polyprenylbenzoate decarboxylase
MKRYILAISGASGSIIGIRVLEELIKASEVHLLVSSNAFSIISHETGMRWKGKTDKDTGEKIRRHFRSKNIIYHGENDMEAPVSSGSFKTDGMLVVPCSMKTLSGIANGYANTLIERAADVAIKEGRMLLLSPREMPLSAIHLENMLKLSRLGVKIAPPFPGFYHLPKGLDEMIGFISGKILDSAGVSHNLFKRWEGKKSKRGGR